MKIMFRFILELMMILIVTSAFTGRSVTLEEESGAKAASDKTILTASRDSYTDAETGMEFVLVKGGCYQMGDTFGDGYENEKPVHEVCLDDFYIGKFKVTQGQWKNVLGNNPSHFKNCGNNCPVENVSWNDAQEFVRILNRRTGKTYRLLTEAEWEYAARSGGKREKWAGTSSESELGGNVWEWVQDTYSSHAYSSHSRNNPLYAGIGSGHVFRGGSWYYNPRGVRAAFRNHRSPAIIIRHHNVGCRLARTP
jgi:formylglycine-generating enzyme required for sulfatase activity